MIRDLKIMMLGEIGVGKTSIVRRLVFDTFDSSYKATIGVDIYSYSLRIKNGTANLLVWDIDGDLGHDIYNHIYITGASGACIVCDATRIATHKTAFGLLDGFVNSLPGRPCILIMNKIDLLAEHDVPLSPQGLEGDTVWTSAKTGQRIVEAFTVLAERCFERGL